ncbi:MAG: hypothetical protein Q9222_004180 [Ikaeria aurantiellina]
MSGGAVIYTGFAVILTCFLGGMTFFAFLAVLLDILFVGVFVAIAILTRGGARSCSGSNPPSVLGPGNRTSCKLETGVFAVAIAMALLFLISAALQVVLSRHHKKEKRYGPGPSNGYTSGSPKKQPFWKRSRGPKTTRDAAEAGTFGYNGVGSANTASTPGKKLPFWKRNKKAPTHDTELGVAGGSAIIAEEKHRHDNHNRHSHDTGVTGTTAATSAYGGSNNRYGNEPQAMPAGNYQNSGADLAAPTTTYQPYREGQTSNHVVHDASPYADVHHGGYPHQASQGQGSTFGQGGYAS